MDQDKIIPYVEPIFRFCHKRLTNPYDAEDLASEILCHTLEGVEKYDIESLDAWVWRIAHNRYARFVEQQNKLRMVLSEEYADLNPVYDDYTGIDGENTERRFEAVFRYLHTLSAMYRDIFVDYYIGEMSVRALAQKYELPETTIKWRLNTGRQKVRERIGTRQMENIYKRINWNTTCCNGAMDSDRYLHTQLARAICKAAYEEPQTVEEISVRTGIPAMYIEDEIPRLEYGDALCTIKKKYAANFIVFRLQDRKTVEGVSEHMVKKIANRFEQLLQSAADTVNHFNFYGHDFGMERLGHFIIPYVLRRKIGVLKRDRMHMENGAYPPRKDGGYGWFIVEETADESEMPAEYNTGCNVAGDDDGSKGKKSGHIYYYWIAKYFDNEIYHNGGTRWLCAKDILQKNHDGTINKDSLSDEDAARLIKKGLIVKEGNEYRLNFAYFTKEQFDALISLFCINDEELENLLLEWIVSVRKSFSKFVPKRLEPQINQWVSLYLFQIAGYVVDELIHRGVLKKPSPDRPFTDGVFYVAGRYINP
ncbi:MAG TPA: sigma-70 family RNA polymerase sigma factor [Firmicutes bacterium]|nr:sigma-70 family RNA polymerase sigma factor [Bacillota bacterium]